MSSIASLAATLLPNTADLQLADATVTTIEVTATLRAIHARGPVAPRGATRLRRFRSGAEHLAAIRCPKFRPADAMRHPCRLETVVGVKDQFCLPLARFSILPSRRWHGFPIEHSEPVGRLPPSSGRGRARSRVWRCRTPANTRGGSWRSRSVLLAHVPPADSDGMSRRVYLPLRTYLEQLPADTQEIVLGFTEIASLLGQDLPSSALNTSFWTHSAAARGNWLAVGFTAKRVPRQRRVIFTRRRSRTSSPTASRLGLATGCETDGDAPA